MSMQNTKIIDQKKYLKKYLSGDKEKKKKKKEKKEKKALKKVKIIDDDAYDDIKEEVDEDLLLGGEDAPQIVGEYIEHDLNIRSKWRNIAVKDEPQEDELRVKSEAKDDADLWGKADRTKIKDEFSPSSNRRLRTSNNSPPRTTRSDSSLPVIKIKEEKRSTSREASPERDLSPPRRRRGSDLSPPRRKQEPDSDLSPPRKRRDSDLSPPRRRRERNADQSPPRRSPARKHRKETSPRRHKFRSRSPRERDQSPRRKPRRSDSANRSPPHRRRSRDRRQDHSPARRIKKEEPSQARRSRWASRSLSPPPTHKPKIERTLDGKKAGLQNAQSLKAETDERRRQEHRLFEQMSSEVSGRDAEVQMRSTGRRGKRARDAAAEDPAERRRKEEHEQKKKELYDRWGKGVKQVEDQKARNAEFLHEASKPVARYANDEDLEQHLRAREHADDPMLEYMREKRKKQEKQSNKPTMPVYEGSYPENRFGIRPGYRWDGVDRSNGYEQRWFDKQNAKRAAQDEAYKYSVEDM
ncbi:BUD13 homolog [Scaptodrosophila lebanonensis]|uniref:BUD13 homolog n=1 Tax=Drosophila lebanonensis TaxID=7225 RepID=A0A6J2TH96_DROLE|nr:BUD13 homolog [Scaptodrosophila lebanonensis]